MVNYLKGVIMKKLFYCEDCDKYLDAMNKVKTVQEGKEVLRKHNLACVPIT